MNFSNNFNNNFLFKNKLQNNHFLNMRYFPQNSAKTLLLNNINSNSQTFKSTDKNYFDNISNPNLNSMKLYKFDNQKNKNESEEEDKIDKSKFIPVNELINQNFEEMSKSQDFSKLKKFVTQMAFQTYKKKDLPNPDNPRLKKLVSKYQDLLKYLLNLEKNVNKYNSALEQNNKKLFNPDLNNFEKEKSYNNKIEKNEQKINNLYQKINKYKNIIIQAKKNTQRTLASFVLIIKDDENNFYCDLCPNNVFKTYKEVQIHNLNVHKHILQLRKKNYEINNNITSPKDNLENSYLNTKMKYIEDEMVTFVDNLYKNKINEIKLKNKNDNNKENDENNQEINKNINDNDVIILEKKINLLEENQKRNQEMLINNLNEFKTEIISQLNELKQNHNLIYTQPKFDIINENEIQKMNDINNNNDNNNSMNNLNNNNENDNNNNNSFALGEQYQENSNESFNNNSNKNDNENNKLKGQKLTNNNNIDFFKKEKNLIINQEKETEKNLKSDKKQKINLGKVTNPNFEINPDNKLQPEINNFISKFCEREKNILFKENMTEQDYQTKYKILKDENETNNENNETKKEEELIEELNNKYKLNKDDITKSGYNNIINEIIEQNQNTQNEQYKAYFNNMLTFLDINKDLATSIIK